MSKGKYYLWSAIGQYGTQFLGLIGNILIARVLMPEDYGLIAMLSIFMGLAWNFTESGFADCLIRKEKSDKLDFGTVATFNIIVGAIMYMLIFFSAPSISRYFKQPELIGIARVLAASIMIKALTVTPITEMRKSLQFKSIAGMNISVSIFSISLTYLMALAGYGYWALVFQNVFIAVANLCYLIFIIKWKPFFCFNVSRFKEMFGFSSNLLISYITNNIGLNLYSMIIGKSYSVDSLGYYRQAQKMYEAPTYGLNAVILTTSYSLIAAEKDKKGKIAMYYNIFSRFATIQSIMVLCLIGLAEPLWHFLLGDKWIPSIPFFKLFMLVSLVYPLVTINSNIAKIHNKSSLYRNLTFLRNGLKVLALIISAKISLIAILYGQIIASYVSAIVDMYFCGRIIDFGILKQLRQFASIFYKPLVPFILASIIIRFLNFDIYLSGIIWALIFAISLLFIYIITKDPVYESFIVKFKKISNRNSS